MFIPHLAAALAFAAPQQSVSERVDARLAAERESLIAFRHELHRWPELSGAEERTAAAVAAELSSLGLEVRTGIAGHGVVAVLQGAGPGRVIAFRADLDAVRSGEPDPVSYRSERPGIRHICGHDVHTTVGVALAHALHEVRDAFHGTLVLVFQPEEEVARGARAMIAAGALVDPEPAEYFAFHTSPLPVGTIGVTPGRALAARDPMRVVLRGTGDLAAAAKRVHATLLAATTLKNPASAPSQTEEFAVVNAFPPMREGDAWIVRGQATVSSEEARRSLARKIEAQLEALRAEGVEGTLEVDTALIPGVFNDRALLAAVEESLRASVGEDGYQVGEGVPPQFSEDFGAFQELGPGVMFWLGVSNPEAGTRGLPHSPDHVADDGAIEVGARAMAALLLTRFGRP